MRLHYSVFILACISALVALVFLKQMPSLVYVFAVEAILTLCGVELLHRHMPQQLREARSDNCLRIDGSFSPRRRLHERRALAKVRMDLLAALLLIVLSGNWLAFFIHYQVIPFNVAIDAAGAFDVDPQAWKQNLRASRVDETFKEWSARKAPADYERIEVQQQLLWTAWPLVVLAFVGWAVGSAIFLSRAYFHIIRSYAAGVASRAEFNVNVDIARLQDAHSI